MRILLALLLAVSSLATHAETCDDAGQIYRVCADQEQLFQSAEQVAAEKKKLLIVIMGAEWCSWCHSLHKIFAEPAFKKRYEKNFNVTEIGLFTGEKENTSGHAVLTKLLTYADEKKVPEGIPLLVVVDPAKKKAVLVPTGPLEKNTAKTHGHDPEKVWKAVEAAAKTLRR